MSALRTHDRPLRVRCGRPPPLLADDTPPAYLNRLTIASCGGRWDTFLLAKSDRGSYHMYSHEQCCKAACLLILLMLSRSAFAEPVTDRVRAAIAAASPESRTELHADGGIEVTGPSGKMTMYTDNVQKECDQYPPAQCDDIIKRFVSAITSVNEGSRFALTESNLYPVIRSDGLLKNLRELMHQEPEKTPISRSFTSDSVVLYAIDSPKAIRFATGKDLERQGLSEERLQAIAAANVKRLDPVKISVLPNSNGLVAAITQDTYATSRLFDPAFVQELEHAVGGPVVVAVPTRDWIVAANAGDAAALTKLKDLAARVFRGEAYSVSPKLVRWDGKTWQELPQ